MELKALSVVSGEYNLKNYEETYQTFDWSAVEKNFSWSETGKVNMAYEAIDRHTLGSKKNKVALYYKNPNREEKYTFKEMKEPSNKAGNVLKICPEMRRHLRKEALTLKRMHIRIFFDLRGWIRFAILNSTESISHIRMICTLRTNST